MFVWLYGKIAGFRGALYEKGVFKSCSLGAPAVSVGNITAGGTGKTPIVAFVAAVLAEKGEKVCILTRGYGRRNAGQRVLVSDGENILADVKTAGDEPFELAGKLLGKAIVVADADRVAAANWAREKFGVSLFVLDDAFQHRRARRDLDIVCIDATNPFGSGKVFLREPLKNLKRADAIIVTRANLIEKKSLANLKSEISKYNAVCPIFTAENKMSELIELKEFHSRAQNAERPVGRRPPAGGHFFAFCALGNPNNFFNQLKHENFDIISTQKFPDHHFYTRKDVKRLEEKARQADAKVFLTTAKDAVKLKNLQFNLPVLVAESEIIFDDEKKLRRLIDAASNPESQILNFKS
ncbi:MAG TPA: tetraacyldisaccharide 4'-kinase [Pyrinomonadaceae bacterium]|jgi:tetraacyldisaccharide 4'-kinase